MDRTTPGDLRLLVDGSRDVLAIHEPDGTYRFVSAAAPHLFGVRAEDLVGRSPFELIHPEDHERLIDGNRALVTGDAKYCDVRYRLLLGDGSIRWVETRTTKLVDPDGEMVLVSSTRDDTEHLALTAAAEGGGARAALAAEAGRVAVWEWHIDEGRVEETALSTMLGYPPGALAGPDAQLGEIIHPDDRDDAIAITEMGLASPEGEYRLDFRMRTADGGHRWIRVLARLVDRTPGRRKVLGASMDVDGEYGRADERQALLVRLQRRQRDLRALDRRRELVDGLAHELRNVIFALDGQVDEARDRLGRDGAELADDLAEVLGRLRGLAARVLDEGDGPRRPVDDGPIRVEDVVRRVLGRYRAQAEKKGIALSVAAETDLPTVDVEPVALDEMVGNLVSNALKFSPRGAAVDARVQYGFGGRVEVRISDRGPGFTPEDRARMFERFATLSARPTDGEPSTGLGLHLVRRLADAMDAELRVEDRAGGGSTIVIVLPDSERLSISGEVTVLARRSQG